MTSQANAQSHFDWGEIVRWGLLAGTIAFFLSLIGMVGTFNERYIIGTTISLGQVFLFGPVVGLSYMTTQKLRRGKEFPGQLVKPTPPSNKNLLLGGLVMGLLGSLPILFLMVIGSITTAEGEIWLRQFLPNVSPQLMEMLRFGQSLPVGLVLMAIVTALLGLAGAGLFLLPPRIKRPLLSGLAAVFAVGLLAEIIILAWGTKGIGLAIRRVVFTGEALSLVGTVLVFVLTVGISILWKKQRDPLRQRLGALPGARQQQLQWTKIAVGVLLLFLLPLILRTYLTEVVNNVGLYILMGLGLNIVVGFAGLLDLGYVAFFAIGAYTVGVLTSTGELGIAHMSWWAAVPFAVLAAVVAGVILGIPVLRMRGDYLAIVTMGFGEIIRILVLSDWFKPLIGGAQGILKIPKPELFGFRFVTPESLYYLILLGCLLAAYVSWRLRDARLGRQWMAMREDEDVAEATGIPLVKTKLLAFATGAAFSGLSGAIFATKLGSVFPHSFNILVSINVLCLIIVGGMGSLPGVVVGSFFLIGLPEFLREFAEYRYLMYGALLVVMMLVRPEGLWPSAITKRELGEEAAPRPVGGGGE